MYFGLKLTFQRILFSTIHKMLIKQEVGDNLSVCVLNLEFAQLNSCFIRNVFS